MYLLNEVLIIFVMSVSVIFLCSRIKIPSIVGFLITGVIIGPHGLGLIKSAHEVEVLAEIGVVLLLFTIGIEFSFRDLVRIKRVVLIGGFLQIGLTIVGVYGIATWLGHTWGQALFFGFLMALSSTAIVLKLLQERAEVESPHGKTSLAILIFQDLAIVPMMLFSPFLSGSAENPFESLFFLGLKGALIILLVWVCTKWIVPFIMHEVARTRSRELFILVLCALCLAIASATFKSGLSLALGAFLAGLIISESEYSYQSLANILPFKDIFTSFFFVSIGMLLDAFFVFSNVLPVILLTLLVMLLKSVVIIVVVLAIGFPLRTAIIAGIALCQIGEFSFVLSQVGLEHGLMDTIYYQFFLAVSVSTMIMTPFLISYATPLADMVMRLPIPVWFGRGFWPLPEQPDTHKYSDHLIIIGYGLNGRYLASAAKISRIKYIIIEMNPETVRQESEKGEPIFYGDATNAVIFNYAQIKKARIVVVAISDIIATRSIVQLARELNRNVHIIVRTRFVAEVDLLYELGVDEVITEEFETSIEIFTRVLTKYLVPQEEIDKFVTEVRSNNYNVFRRLTKENVSFCDLNIHLHNLEVKAFVLEATSPDINRSLAELQYRLLYGVTVLAIHRHEETISNPSGSITLQPSDIIVVLGLPGNIATFAHRLSS